MQPSPSNTQLKFSIQLAGGPRAELTLQIRDEPLYPTPQEPDHLRLPSAAEWLEIRETLAAHHLNAPPESI